MDDKFKEFFRFLWYILIYLCKKTLMHSIIDLRGSLTLLFALNLQEMCFYEL
jgi:hypothetical protein